VKNDIGYLKFSALICCREPTNWLFKVQHIDVRHFVFQV